MKKLFAMIAMLSVAGMAQANMWNILWTIGGAYSPDDPTKGVLEDYSVTWGLWNATDDVRIAEMFAAAGSDEIFIEDPNPDGETLYYNQKLKPEDSMTYRGETDKSGIVSVYQYIYLDNGTDTYEWISAAVDIEIASSSMAAASSIAGENDLIGKDVAWTKTSGGSAVPEPATMSLLGLGALAMVLRRKLSK